ncbi:patatin-like phospholipase family protein [Simiduia aestuariiviva]|uniref:NTE family protein n=1 Tax=Simiduia aestuariiviva TaxID=1510459 RepID=A0A839UTV1_9GAMM|nr:patatin-like phospholipase family protein [Simiduia aestuariiviva]MBB3168928.1 NTE family protein [Simiduia aestuariiviva]
MTDKQKKSVSLVLGSGGARGMAHIGVIKWLEENNYKIVSVSGASIGALIGGVYACGKLPDFEKWITALNRMDIVRLMDFSWQRSGLLKGDKIINALIEKVGNHDIENLAIKFTAVAANLKTEKEVWIQSGPLFDAIRASISLPLFFTPYTLNGKTLVDGGVLNPVPIAPTFGDHSDITLAVNLGGEPEPSQPKKPAKQEQESNLLHPKIQQFIDHITDNWLPGDNPNDDRRSAHDIADQAFDAMQASIARQMLAAYPPDITITLPRNACGTMDFDRAKELIERGYALAEQTMGKKEANEK